MRFEWKNHSPLLLLLFIGVTTNDSSLVIGFAFYWYNRLTLFKSCRTILDYHTNFWT